MLGIEESSSPILLIKRDLNATPPRKLLDRAARYDYGEEDEQDEDEQGYSLGSGGGDDAEHASSDEDWELPRHLDPEWFAFEVWTEPLDDDQSVDDPDESDTEAEFLKRDKAHEYNTSRDPLGSAFSELSVKPPTNLHMQSTKNAIIPTLPPTNVTVRSNLSLLECLLRLASLQNFQQASHLTVHDELLNLFLSDANSWLGSRELREREREDTRRRIGFDPFGSPISSAENSMEAPGTPRKVVKKEIPKIASQPEMPLEVGPSWGGTLLSLTPKGQPARSQSPGAQLLFESTSKKMHEDTVSRSFPSTPAQSSLHNSTYQSIHSASKLVKHKSTN